jgi:hypothetical protein
LDTYPHLILSVFDCAVLHFEDFLMHPPREYYQALTTLPEYAQAFGGSV